MGAAVHPTAIVDPKARIGEGTVVGPFCVIGAEVVIGAGNRIGSHTVVEGPAIIGESNRVGNHCSLGAPPQDLGYKGEPTKLVIGNNNFLGDYVQVSRGTMKTAHHTTTIGNDNFLMAYSHIGHDCNIANRVIASNGLQLAGHVTVEDRVVFGGLVAMHQFCRVGTMAMIAGGSVSSMDIPPYCRVGGWGCAVFGLNLVGLERGGMDKPAIRRLREAYKVIFRGVIPYEEALKKLETEFADCVQAQHWVKFFRESERGVVRERENK